MDSFLHRLPPQRREQLLVARGITKQRRSARHHRCHPGAAYRVALRKRSKEVTSKEEAFCRAVALEGKTLSDAYRATRDCSRMKTSSINSNAKKIARRESVKLRIDQLKEHGLGDGVGLTPKQHAFCFHYLETSSASEAYRRAYDVSPTTKAQTVHRKAAEVRANGKVSARIAELQAAHLKRHEVTVDRVIAELARIGFSDIRDVIEWGYSVAVKDAESGEATLINSVAIKASKHMTPEAAAAVAAIEQTRDGGIKIKLHDKCAALADLSKYLGMFKADNEQASKTIGEAIGNPRHPSRAVLDILRGSTSGPV